MKQRPRIYYTEEQKAMMSKAYKFFLAILILTTTLKITTSYTK